MSETSCSCDFSFSISHLFDDNLFGSFIDPSSDERIVYQINLFTCLEDKFHEFLFDTYSTPLSDVCLEGSFQKDGIYFFNDESTLEWGSISEGEIFPQTELKEEFQITIAVKNLILITESNSERFIKKKTKVIINPGKKTIKETKERIKLIGEDEEEKMQLLEELMNY